MAARRATKQPDEPHALEAIRVRDDDGDLMVRDSLVLTLFTRAPSAAACKGALLAIDAMRALVPKGVLRFSLVGEDSTSHVRHGPKREEKLRAELSGKATSAFVLLSSDEDPEAPAKERSLGPAFMARVSLDGAYDDDCVGTLELRFPSDFAAGGGADAFVDFANQVAEGFPFSSGHASLALTTYPLPISFESRKSADSLILELAAKDDRLEAGLDVAHWLGARSLGARWLTFLGPSLSSAVGGAATIAAEVPQAHLTATGGGLAIRVGSSPTVVSAADRAALTTLARVLKPVTLFWSQPLLHASRTDHEEDLALVATVEWRHLGGVEAAIGELQARDDPDSKARLAALQAAPRPGQAREAREQQADQELWANVEAVAEIARRARTDEDLATLAAELSYTERRHRVTASRLPSDVARKLISDDGPNATSLAHALGMIAQLFMQDGEWQAALALFDHLVERDDLEPVVYKHALYAVQDDNNHLGVNEPRARRYLERCLPKAPLRSGAFLNAACVALELGQRAQCLELLGEAVRQGTDLTPFANHPFFAPVANEATFKSLVAQSRQSSS